AEKQAQKVIDLSKMQDLSFDDLRKAYETKADAQLKQGQNLAAVETLTTLLGMKNSQVDLTTTRFKAGDILYNEGDIRAAEEIWKSIDGSKSPLLARLVSEKLDHAQWKKDHKKYFQRIPAMSGIK
ncbi:MAG: hypothetical protein KDD22_05535, partial [Bdellovibrionales bacterium]|nr:hypothetical protein [Bdellovibrionales bacterium]